MPVPLLIAAAYLVGAVPFGLLTARWGCGVDIRTRGSGNIGATNVGRELGWRWGALVLLLDALKGLLPTLAPTAFTELAGTPLANAMVGCGIAAVVGHMFPAYLGFRGGKGVATGLGVAAAVAPAATLAAFAAFVMLTLTLRYVGLSSVVAAVTFAAVQLAREGSARFTAAAWPLGLFSLAVPALIVFRHRGNLARLWRGEEPKTFGKPKATGEPRPPESDPDGENAPADRSGP